LPLGNVPVYDATNKLPLSDSLDDQAGIKVDFAKEKLVFVNNCISN
jgi:hypothetical protein